MSTAVKKEHKSARPERGGPATMVEAIRQGIWEEMERDPTVFVIGEDVGTYGGAFKVTDGLLDEFGEARVIDTPISEGAIVGAACGAALMGMRPVAEFQFIDFISAGFDLLTNYAAKCRYRWGAGGYFGCVSWTMRLRGAHWTIPLPECRVVFSKHRWSQNRRAIYGVRRQRFDQGGDSRSRSRYLFRTQKTLPPATSPRRVAG